MMVRVSLLLFFMLQNISADLRYSFSACSRTSGSLLTIFIKFGFSVTGFVCAASIPMRSISILLVA